MSLITQAIERRATMKTTRRQFLKISAATGASLLLTKVRWPNPVAYAFSQSDNLQKFVQSLRGVGDIPVAQPDAVNPGWWQPGVTHYTIDIGQFEDQLHPDLPNPTRLWGFGQGGNFKHLGGIIAAKRDEPVQITFRNNLPPDHIIPVDDTIMGVMGNQNNRADVHLHGGFVPWISDGGPHAWWDPNGNRGVSFQSQFLNPTLAGNEAEYYYPNHQSARLMWYHDHAFGITRINAYAGIATGYVVYDDYETITLAAYGLPGPLDPKTVYLVFQDKIFVTNNIAATDPTWNVPNSRAGDLWYAHVYDTDRYGALGPAPAGPPPDPSVVPEYFGDTILVNGTVYPTVTLPQGQYRLRLLNACNARFLNPRLVYAQGATFPDNTEPNANAAGPAFIQIGNEGGFLQAPAMFNGPGQPLLLLAPAERADVLVDLRTVPAGSTLILYNDAAGPFPMGDTRNDYYPGNPKTPNSMPGYGPNTRTLLQIQVAAGNPKEPTIKLPRPPFTPTDPFLIKQSAGIPTTYTVNGGFATIKLANGSKVQAMVRSLTLNEAFDEHGRLIQFLGTNVPTNPGAKALQFGRGYMDEVTENPAAGSYEIWEIANLTGDTHPIHFHLVNVQILWRQKFNVNGYAGTPNYQGMPVGPDANELGWKETVRMNPGEVTSVLMKFDLPQVPFAVPASPRTGGNEYVWHCHILEHEEHDMMRPLIVT
jgi:FtsP/CotA-like multicopper oxidase with cupredoxin domain